MVHAMGDRMLAVDERAVTIKYDKSERICGHVGSFILSNGKAEPNPKPIKDRVPDICNQEPFFALPEASETNGEI
jgi:hypothetical protein